MEGGEWSWKRRDGGDAIKILLGGEAASPNPNESLAVYVGVLVDCNVLDVLLSGILIRLMSIMRRLSFEHEVKERIDSTFPSVEPSAF